MRTVTKFAGLIMAVLLLAGIYSAWARADCFRPRRLYDRQQPAVAIFGAIPDALRRKHRARYGGLSACAVLRPAPGDSHREFFESQTGL
ncbi:hypothetical protein [Desulfosporosinus fructosivorans]